MPNSITEYFKIDKLKFAETGAFDSFLDQDTHLFIDPFLLNGSSHVIFKNAREDLLDRFREIIKLLTTSKYPQDIFWREAYRKLQFKEIAGFGLGYSKGGTSGSGIGANFTKKLLNSATEIISAGVLDPEIFELVGLFEEGIGCDRVSDMTANILLPLFFQYSDYVFTACGLKFESYNFKGYKFNVPNNPFLKNTPVLLCPKEFLRDLPIVGDWWDISFVCDKNNDLRQKLNNMLGRDWRKRTKGFNKYQIRQILISNPVIFKEIISSYKKIKPLGYDWEIDPSGEFAWRDAVFNCLKTVPLNIDRTLQPLEVAEIICNHFKILIEANGLWKLLYKDDQGKFKKHERAAQLLFFGIASAYCKANNLDISPESNGGSGPVDFKISRGAKGKTLVELKLSTNSKILSGFEKQVSIYKKAEGADFTIYLVLKVGESDKIIEKLNKIARTLDVKGIPRPKILFVDALPKKSASKA